MQKPKLITSDHATWLPFVQAGVVNEENKYTTNVYC